MVYLEEKQKNVYPRRIKIIMALDLRQAVLQNIRDKSENQLTKMVTEAIEDHEEKTLPGLGVIFEVIWQHTDSKTQKKMISSLSKELKNGMSAIPEKPKE